MQGCGFPILYVERALPGMSCPYVMIRYLPLPSRGGFLLVAGQTSVSGYDCPWSWVERDLEIAATWGGRTRFGNRGYVGAVFSVWLWL